MTAPKAPWLFGPVPDLLLGCGLAYALMVALFGAMPQIISSRPGYLPQLLVMIFSMSHYGGTLLRVYEERSERRAYVIFSLWATLAIFALFIWGAHSAWVGAAMVTLYLTWSPWHYTGQNYGIGLMFLRRGGIDIPPDLKRWIYASFLLAFLMTAVVMHASPDASYSPADFDATRVLFVPLGIPKPVATGLLALLGSAYLVATAGAAYRLLRVAPARMLLPTALLALTQCLWFALPFSVHYFGVQTGFDPIDRQLKIRDYTILVFIFHGLQYLWITTYYARQGPRWSGFGDYWAKALICGVAIWTIPFMLFAPGGLGKLPFDGGMALIVAAGINLHHFVVDGAIWKLRNSRIASVLIRSGHDEAQSDAGSPWMRRAVWTVAVVGLLAGIFEFVQWRVAYPTASRRGDLVAAEAALDRLDWIGYGRVDGRRKLGNAFLRSGEYSAAARQFEAAVALQAEPMDWNRLGQIRHHQSDFEGARTAYQHAIDLSGGRMADPYVGLGAVANEAGRFAEAIGDYERALALQPENGRTRMVLAWLLSTAPEASLRDPERALSLLEGTVRDPDAADAYGLEVLSASYAALGRFDEALATARRAERLALAKEDADHAGRIRMKIALYERGLPFVDQRADERVERARS